MSILPTNDFTSARDAETPAPVPPEAPQPAGAGDLSLEKRAHTAAKYGVFKQFYRFRTPAEKARLRAVMPEHCPK